MDLSLSRAVKPQKFFRALSESPSLKLSFAWLTLIGLVFPTAIVMTAGVPGQYALPALLVLILPFQYLIFCLTRAGRAAADNGNRNWGHHLLRSCKYEVSATDAHRARSICVELTPLEGKEAGRDVVISSVERIVIGRQRDCDVVLPEDSHISARHCELRLVDGHVMLFQLDSSHRTMCNGSWVTVSKTLQSGDIIRVGRTEFRVTVEPSDEI